MKIFREKAGIISVDRCCVAYHKGYLYTADTLLQLLWTVLTEFNNDKHLVG